MALIQGKFIANNAIDASKIKLLNDQALRSRNAADNADVDLIKLDTSDNIILANDAFIGANKIVTAAEKGAANGVAPLDGSGLISSIYLPSFVDDVLEYANLAAFPGTGETGKIYVALDTNKTYRWSGSAYVEISASAVDSVQGLTGVVSLDTDDIPEGVSNLYYASSLFNTDFSSKTSDDLSEGVTNLFFSDARAKTAAVVNSTAGSETDQAASVSAMKSYVASEIGAAAPTFDTQIITLTGTDISNGYVDLAQTPTALLDVTPVGALKQEEGVDYTLSTNRLTFAGDLATLLVTGDKLMVTYAY